MKLHSLTPRDALSKAFRKVKPTRDEIEVFSANLLHLLDQVNEAESEEFHKNLLSDFLKDTYYKQNHFINTKDRKDLVIHNGAQASTTVGVIVEVKKPKNKSEMLTQEQLNRKAFQELVLYYLRERITHRNLEVRHLVVTNIHEWFIFDAAVFERLFAQNKSLVKQFIDFEGGRLADTKTDFFYKQIAEPFIDALSAEVEFTYVSLAGWKSGTRSDKELTLLYKLFAPEHLLKLPFANDSNSLDRRFYSELLHIIGLTETKEGGKKLIQRNKASDRQGGSLLEDTLTQLDALDKLRWLDKPGQYGATPQEQLFNVALELSITWVNRVLFLKLLEAQLIAYHQKDRSYGFLSLDKIKNYDDLSQLFFQVLARKTTDRSDSLKAVFGKVPYLNSSLFEPTELEQRCFTITQLNNNATLPLFPQTVLKDDRGRKAMGELPTLEYLFRFLDAYDFGAEGGEEIRENNKTLINASVLGLIFEKINGYKDGSFFTPGFITMYICRETIRKAVVRKFAQAFPAEQIQRLEDIAELIRYRISPQEANTIVNSLKICDPAVGSGHFLVSALNEIIALKSDLRILLDKNGQPLRDTSISVVNDALYITDLDSDEEHYYLAPKPRTDKTLRLYAQGGVSHSPSTIPYRQRVQEALFHEKQTIIENCLFGVDINPNSVKICRLRLWIELLKNAYYTSESNFTELETLPNIDINIKSGNSLVSRFPIEADLKQALRKAAQGANRRWTMESYRLAVQTYRNARNKDEKEGMKELMLEIKQGFSSEIRMSDPRKKRLDKLVSELYHRFTGTFLFEPESPYGKHGERLAKQRKQEQEKLEKEIEQLNQQLDELKTNTTFEHSFEWRFEFPEVLNDEGEFVGFDIVIGNPPYIRQEEFSDLKGHLLEAFPETGTGTADLFVYFVELALRLLRDEGEFAFIIPNKWMRASYGKKLRQFVAKYQINCLVDFGDLPVFDEATTYPNIVWLTKTDAQETFVACNVKTLDFSANLQSYLQEHPLTIRLAELSAEGWSLSDTRVQTLLTKLRSKGVPLGDYVNGKIFYGIKTGLNEAFVIDRATRDRLVAEDARAAEIIKPFLAGRDIKRYQHPESDKYLVLFPKGFTKERRRATNDNEEKDEISAWEWVQTTYPSLANHLLPFSERAKRRTDQGDYWWELRACDYYEEFEQPKVMLPDISLRCEALFDESADYYCVNTAYIIPGLTKSDLGILNSRLTLFFYSNLTQTIRGGYLRFIRQYLEQIPMLKTDQLDALVSEIIEVKKQDPYADTSELEAAIDRYVYALYDLSPYEIELIEQALT